MRIPLVFLLSLLLATSSLAQERVRNVRIRVIDSSQLEIRYDLIEIHPGDSVYVDMESRLRGELRILPEFIRGDIGKRVTAGSDRRIVWDALASGYPLNEDIRAIVSVKAGPLISSAPVATQQPNESPAKPTEPVATKESKSADPEMPVVSTPTEAVSVRKTRYAGPAWALLSAVAPGIGNIFVQMPKPKVGLRPLVTIGCYGLLAYGLSERQKSHDEYALYEQQKNMTAAEPYYTQANSHHQNYYLATRGAIVVAAIDVILTFMKGLRNNRLQRTQGLQPVTVRPGLQAGQLTAVVHYSF
ncbi:hypothetical protein IC230_23905 [Spirosoma sp. BT704]|uniref:DUF5683 domain-containing protein n=2 Tax=Spirosoma validum TaxID=2771355 RepID=A0A927GFL9_9BACT|nr:hypothetical protein [Spirosoma validum]